MPQEWNWLYKNSMEVLWKVQQQNVISYETSGLNFLAKILCGSVLLVIYTVKHTAFPYLNVIPSCLKVMEIIWQSLAFLIIVSVCLF